MNTGRVPVLLDTDIGDDIDDAWALSVCLNHPLIDLKGVTTVWNGTLLRAAQARYLLEQAGQPQVPVAAGNRDAFDRLLRLQRNCQADVIPPGEEERLLSGRTDAVAMMAQIATDVPGLVLLPVGPLTNIARFILEFRDAFEKVERIVLMGGHTIADRTEPEYNVGCDPRASQIVFSCGKPITMVGLDVTYRCRMSAADIAAIEAKRTPLSEAIVEMTRLWQQAGSADEPRMPIVHDPLAALVAAEPDAVVTAPKRLQIDDAGNCVEVPGAPVIDVAVDVDPDAVKGRVVELVG